MIPVRPVVGPFELLYAFEAIDARYDWSWGKDPRFVMYDVNLALYHALVTRMPARLK